MAVFSLSVQASELFSSEAAELLTWPRMRAPAFGCMLETQFGVIDPVFNCSTLGEEHETGDPCKNTIAYYSGIELPADFGPRVHPSIEFLELSWEHGELQNLTIHFGKAMTDSDVEGLLGFSLDGPHPSNIMSVSKQQCGKVQSCVMLLGFDHAGAGDMDCDQIDAE